MAALQARVRPPTDPALRARVERVQADMAHGNALFLTGRWREALAVGSGWTRRCA